MHVGSFARGTREALGTAHMPATCSLASTPTTRYRVPSRHLRTPWPTTPPMLVTRTEQTSVAGSAPALGCGELVTAAPMGVVMVMAPLSRLSVSAGPPGRPPS